ncbi:methionine ABC transporter ATP-binding protein [Lactococcus petauri]|uniref:Methionine ABC transporter ATP-binding protein n=1 Tax=Lactococcus petauri TaxID=1940789 RepID=A0AAJ2ISI3_9LACT|nr:methionine ABC transporter ATP-binding protein [Lactococcus petauri]MDT2583793.1 methionine ABC transporter ATP-binding protein [Lactococcus petauri]
MAIIELNNIRVSYETKKNKVDAVKDTTIHIEKGDIFGIIGYSGAGKSTIVRTINLLQKPSAGEVKVNGKVLFKAGADGKDQAKIKTAELRKERQKIGMIFQHFNLLNEKTVFENIEFALLHTPLSDKQKEEKIRELLHLVSLSEFEEKYPAQLSGGQKQRVAIARALANDPEILISDEGTSALDPKTTNQILDLLKDLQKRLGLTIVLITHEMHVVKEIANKVAVMQNGEVIEQNNLLEIFAHPQEQLTQQFIDTTSNVSRFIHSLTENDTFSALAEDEELIYLSYYGNQSGEPAMSEITRKFDVSTNIFYGNVEVLQNTRFGSLVVSLKGTEENRWAAKEYLAGQNIEFTVLKAQVK